MNKQLEQATISVLLCSVVILLNMDLSYLKTKMATAVEKREINKRYEEQRYTFVLPNDATISLNREVQTRMANYVSRLGHSEIKVDNLPTPKGVNCRGSPLIRSP